VLQARRQKRSTGRLAPLIPVLSMAEEAPIGYKKVPKVRRAESDLSQSPSGQVRGPPPLVRDGSSSQSFGDALLPAEDVPIGWKVIRRGKKGTSATPAPPASAESSAIAASHSLVPSAPSPPASAPSQAPEKTAAIPAVAPTPVPTAPAPKTEQGERCCQCAQLISSDDGLEALGKIWHIECFKCDICHKVVEEEIFVLNQKKGVPVHQACAKLSSVVCDHCGKDIIGKLKASLDNQKKFHLECWEKLDKASTGVEEA